MLHAEFSIAPLLFLAAFAVMSSLAKNKQRGAAPRSAPGAAPEPRAGFMSELQSAMEELKKVQREQTASTLEAPQAPQTSQERIAAAWLARQKARKALLPTGRVRSSRALLPLEDDADQSSETGESLEGQDYDDDAERIVDARRQAAEQWVAASDEAPRTPTTLPAPRASQAVQAPGGITAPKAWHGEIGAAGTGEADTAVKPVTRLGRFADGSARSAIILSEILGTPVGQRDR